MTALACDSPGDDGGMPVASSGAVLPSKAVGSDPGGDPCNVWSNLSDDELLGRIHQTVSADYRPIDVERDRGGELNRYVTARRLMFTRIERRPSPNQGPHLAECVYTGTTAPAPQTAEPNRDLLNAEHLWPRSLMMDESRWPTLYAHQEADIHALVPSIPRANDARGNVPFGDVDSDENAEYAPSLLGVDRLGQRVMEVRRERRGDVARAMFYFSARWGLAVGEVQEEVLKVWNRRDPPDEIERTRNQLVSAIQGNRNPFIDCPQLIDQISNFRSFSSRDNESNLPFP
ncbi:MAG: endonuclease [Myxococcota bacterium]|nr:endonuclease [Myxococcota bacterium]